MSETFRSVLVALLFTLLSGLGIPGAQAAADTASAFELTDADGNGSIDVEEYRARQLLVFSALDQDGDGFIVLAEIPKDRKDVFAVVDTDGNKRIILREYMLYIMPRFWKADYDGNNVLSPAEVKAADEREAAS